VGAKLYLELQIASVYGNLVIEDVQSEGEVINAMAIYSMGMRESTPHYWIIVNFAILRATSSPLQCSVPA
jgi:hypothetical protein